MSNSSIANIIERDDHINVTTLVQLCDLVAPPNDAL